MGVLVSVSSTLCRATSSSTEYCGRTAAGSAAGSVGAGAGTDCSSTAAGAGAAFLGGRGGGASSSAAGDCATWGLFGSTLAVGCVVTATGAVIVAVGIAAPLLSGVLE